MNHSTKIYSNLILVICSFINFSIAQDLDTMWTKTFGGTNIDVGHCVQETVDGGYIITGYTRSFGAMSGRNVWLIKTDAFGNEEWNNAFGGNDDDEGYSVQQTADSGYIIAGYTKSFGSGLNDVFLVKTDASGNEIWSKTFGGTQDDEGYSLVVTKDSGFVIAGVTSSFGAGSRDVWLIKTDPSGNVVWNKTFGGLSSDGAWYVQKTFDEGFIITGWTFSNGPGFLGNVFLVKTDSLGNQEWNNFFGGSDADRGYSVQQTADSGYVIAGYTGSFGAGLYDMLLIKTDGSGNEVWTKTFGGSGRDYGNSVDKTSDGGFIITGYTLSFGAGGDDLWVVKTDSAGNEVWSNTYGGSSSDVGYYIKETSDGGYIITGHTLSFGAGVHDVWLLKLESLITDFEEHNSLTTSYYLNQNYPNPFNPITKIKFTILQDLRDETREVTLKVYDILGNEISILVNEEKPLGEYEVEFDGANLPSGIYFYQLKVYPANGGAGNFVETKKMVLLR